MLEFWIHTGRQRGMMGAVVTGRPVESAWLLHSERKGTIVDSHGQTHMGNTVCLEVVPRKSGNMRRASWYKRITGF